jgi:uncharacterized membrane protein
MKKARKAVGGAAAAALVALVTILVAWVTTGQFNQQELTVAIVGVITTVVVPLVVYYLKNDLPEPTHENDPTTRLHRR